MIDTRTAAHKAFYAALNSDAAVIALADVWSHPEEGTEPTASKGLVLVGLAGVSEEGTKDDQQFDEVTIDIIVYIRRPEITALYEVSHACRAALEGQVITTAGAEIERPRFLTADSDLLDDGQTYMDTLRFAAYVQPA